MKANDFAELFAGLAQASYGLRYAPQLHLQTCWALVWLLETELLFLRRS